MNLKKWINKIIPIRIVLKTTEVPITKINLVKTEVPTTKVETVTTEVPITKIETVTTEVPVEKVKIVETEIPVTKVETTTTEIPTTKVEIVTTEVPITKIETIKTEVAVEKVNVVEIEKPIINDNVTENFTKLNNLLKTNTEDFNTSLLNIITQTQNLDKTLKSFKPIGKTLEKVEKVEVEVEVENPLNKKLETELILVKSERDKLKKEIEESNVLDIKDIRMRYQQLYDFAFTNLDPFTKVDVLEAQHYWKNIINKKS